MDLRSLAQWVPGLHFLSEVKAEGKCVLPGHPDDDSSSLLLKQNGDRLSVGCYAGLGHTTDAILSAWHLTRQDLIVSRPPPSEHPAIATEPPAAAFSGNGSSSNGSAAANGHFRPPPEFDAWRLRLGYVIKGALDAVPEKDRQLIASGPKNRTVDLIVKQAHELIAEHDPQVWPLPAELAETEVDEEIQKLAGQAVDVFWSAYGVELPPASSVSTEIDRNPVDAYEAYQVIQSDRREHSWEGLIRTGCTMVLTALIGAGKTTLATNVVRGWALGEYVLGRACRKSKSLVVVSPKEFEAWAEIIHFWELRAMVYLIPSYKTHFDSAAEQAGWFEMAMKKLGCETFCFDTLFDFFGMPPNTRGDSNRIAMNEQVPLLETVRANNWSGLVTGHSPKSEAQAVVNRDPEEACAGHTAWTAQHRTRAVIRRKSPGVNAFVTGRGGYGDQGILKEEMLLFDEGTRLVSLGGAFADYLGQTALPSILDGLSDGWHGRSDLIKSTGKTKNWVYAAVKFGLKNGSIKWNGKGGRSAKYALPDEPSEEDQQNLGI